MGYISIIQPPIPTGEVRCSFEEAETLRKLKEFPGMTAVVLALADAALWGVERTIDLPSGDSVELLARLSRIPGAMTALRMLLNT